MSLTTVREAMRDQLAADLGIPFVDGRIEGPVERRNLGCCWTDGVVEDESDVNHQVVTIVARAFLRYDRSREPESPIDPAPLEHLAERIQLSVRSQHSIAGVDFARAVRVGINMERRGVECEIRVWMANPASPMVG